MLIFHWQPEEFYSVMADIDMRLNRPCLSLVGAYFVLNLTYQDINFTEGKSPISGSQGLNLPQSSCLVGFLLS